ncbi:MAG: hypothetical protein KFF68_00410 [Desulfosarcina sp.]|nr:hypothetical protein [Desulfosarcina sp.]
MALLLGIGVWLVFRFTRGAQMGLRPVLILVLTIVIIDRQGQLVQRFTAIVGAESRVDIFKSMDG